MVCNTPTYCTDDVADHAVALMAAAPRAGLDAAMRRGATPAGSPGRRGG